MHDPDARRRRLGVAREEHGCRDACCDAPDRQPGPQPPPGGARRRRTRGRCSLGRRVRRSRTRGRGRPGGIARRDDDPLHATHHLRGVKRGQVNREAQRSGAQIPHPQRHARRQTPERDKERAPSRPDRAVTASRSPGRPRNARRPSRRSASVLSAPDSPRRALRAASSATPRRSLRAPTVAVTSSARPRSDWSGSPATATQTFGGGGSARAVVLAAPRASVRASAAGVRLMASPPRWAARRGASRRCRRPGRPSRRRRRCGARAPGRGARR